MTVEEVKPDPTSQWASCSPGSPRHGLQRYEKSAQSTAVLFSPASTSTWAGRLGLLECPLLGDRSWGGAAKGTPAQTSDWLSSPGSGLGRLSHTCHTKPWSPLGSGPAAFSSFSTHSKVTSPCQTTSGCTTVPHMPVYTETEQNKLI